MEDPINNKRMDEGYSKASDFIRSSPVAAIIVGIARKKENSTAASLDNPEHMAPKMDAADLEIPGIIEKDCAIPMSTACW